MDDVRVPGLESVAPGTWSVGMPMPGGHIPFSALYLIEDETRGLHVIDPGWGSDENWQVLGAALAQLGRNAGDVRTITVTHLHQDHLGMADRLRAASGAPVVMHRFEQQAKDGMAGGVPAEAAAHEIEGWGVPGERRGELDLRAISSAAPPSADADLLVDDGDLLPIPGRELEVLLTPGHTPGHICLRDAQHRLIFTGDHVLPTIYSGLGLGGRTETNAMADYLGSLARVALFDDHEVCPGHGYRFFGLAERCRQISEHHLRRTREVLAALDERPDASVWGIASGLTWTAGWEKLSGFYLLSALSQTAMHLDFVRSGGARAFV